MQNDTYINKKANNIYFLFRFTFEENFAQISPKFRPNFNFVFYEIFAKLKKNFAKIRKRKLSQPL